MSLPNKLSVLRILLAPAIVACLVYYSPERDWLRFVALGFFSLGVVTDALDGIIARAQNSQSQLGTILDPTADKLLILSTLISCSVIHGLPDGMRIPAWFNLVVLSRDALVVTGSVVLFMIRGRWSVQPNYLGKCTTVAQMMVIPTVLLGLPVKQPLLIAATLLTALSGASYVRMGLRVLD